MVLHMTISLSPGKIMAMEHIEAQYEVTDWTEEEQGPFCIETVTYCDNKYSAGGAKPFLPISMTNAVVQDIK